MSRVGRTSSQLKRLVSSSALRPPGPEPSVPTRSRVEVLSAWKDQLENVPPDGWVIIQTYASMPAARQAISSNKLRKDLYPPGTSNTEWEFKIREDEFGPEGATPRCEVWAHRLPGRAHDVGTDPAPQQEAPASTAGASSRPNGRGAWAGCPVASQDRLALASSYHEGPLPRSRKNPLSPTAHVGVDGGESSGGTAGLEGPGGLGGAAEGGGTG